MVTKVFLNDVCKFSEEEKQKCSTEDRELMTKEIATSGGQKILYQGH